MNPWIILGWLILGVVLTGILISLGIILVGACKVVAEAWSIAKRSRATRDIPFAEGQTWTNGRQDVHIRTIFDNGRLGITISGYSAGWDAEKFRERIKKESFYLKSGPRGTS